MGSNFIIAEPIGIFRREHDAGVTAQAERDMGNVTIDGFEFKQRMAMSKVDLPQATRKVWVTWSNAFSKDGTGVFLGRIDGAFATEEEARTMAAKVPQGLQDVRGHASEVVTKVVGLEVR